MDALIEPSIIRLIVKGDFLNKFLKNHYMGLKNWILMNEFGSNGNKDR
jgi:hypothetical protein